MTALGVAIYFLPSAEDARVVLRALLLLGVRDRLLGGVRDHRVRAVRHQPARDGHDHGSELRPRGSRAADVDLSGAHAHCRPHVERYPRWRRHARLRHQCRLVSPRDVRARPQFPRGRSQSLWRRGFSPAGRNRRVTVSRGTKWRGEAPLTRALLESDPHPCACADRRGRSGRCRRS